MCQTVSQSDPLPCQQAVGGYYVKKGGIEDIISGLGHHQPTTQKVEVIQRHEET